MDTVLRAVAVYIILFVVIKIGGKRTLMQMTSFDFILLLIIGEATQQALLADDISVTGALIVIVTLMSVDIAFVMLKTRFPRWENLVDGYPTILIEQGRPLHWRLRKLRLTLEDVMQVARTKQGVETLAEIKFAIMEETGEISIIPRSASEQQHSG